MAGETRAQGLDTLRGCAVLSVLGYHYLNNTSVLRTPALSFLQAASEHLFFGVDMFFVLSGFLIGASLMRAKGQPGYFRTISLTAPLEFCHSIMFGSVSSSR
jgi:peptidoglycan/LPS O-acetylase OafA/YrhL